MIAWRIRAPRAKVQLLYSERTRALGMNPQLLSSHALPVSLLETVAHSVGEMHNASNPQPFYSIFASGGGVSVLQWLLGVPGGSRSIKSAQIPYCRASFQEIVSRHRLGGKLQSLCSEEAAIVLAKEAYEKTVQFVVEEDKPPAAQDDNASLIFGVGCTASLASSSLKRGDHRFHIAVFSQREVRTTSVTLDKSLGRSRAEEDATCSLWILAMLRERMGLTPLPSSILQSPYFPPVDVVAHRVELVPSALEDVVAGRRTHALLIPSATPPLQWRCVDQPLVGERALVFPGSFNPLHAGHCALVSAALRLGELGTGPQALHSVVFELSATNADKPEIALDSILSRMAQFHEVAAAFPVPVYVAVTRLPLFASKARVFPRSSFLVGADTLVRLLNPKYYLPPVPPPEGMTPGDMEQQGLVALAKALGEMNALGCDFIVGGRSRTAFKDTSLLGDFLTLRDVLEGPDGAARAILRTFPETFWALSEQAFRMDISSTEIRQRL